MRGVGGVRELYWVIKKEYPGSNPSVWEFVYGSRVHGVWYLDYRIGALSSLLLTCCGVYGTEECIWY